jgi:hypothetical protein
VIGDIIIFDQSIERRFSQCFFLLPSTSGTNPVPRYYILNDLFRYHLTKAFISSPIESDITQKNEQSSINMENMVILPEKNQMEVKEEVKPITEVHGNVIEIKERKDEGNKIKENNEENNDILIPKNPVSKKPNPSPSKKEKPPSKIYEPAPPLVLSWADRVKSPHDSFPVPSPNINPVISPPPISSVNPSPSENIVKTTSNPNQTKSANIEKTLDPSLSLFVRNIPSGTTDETIKEVFNSLSSKLSPPNQFMVISVSLKNSGYAFVEFQSSNDSKKALNAALEHPISISNQELHVEERNPVPRGRGRGKRDENRKPPR